LGPILYTISAGQKKMLELATDCDLEEGALTEYAGDYTYYKEHREL